MQQPDAIAKLIIDEMNDISNYIALQGNVGSGKSTIMKHIKTYIASRGMCAKTLPVDEEAPLLHKDYFIVVDEPLEAWTDAMYSTLMGCGTDCVEKSSILSLFYSDMSKWAFIFQIKAFTSRLQLIKVELGKLKAMYKKRGARVHIIAERSLITDRMFMKNLYDSKLIMDIEWQIYNEFYGSITESIVARENVMVYVNTPYEKCFERVNKRNRVEEVSNDGENEKFIAYLASLEEKHGDMVDDFVRSKPGVNQCIELDWGIDKTDAEIEEKVVDLMAKLIAII